MNTLIVVLDQLEHEAERVLQTLEPGARDHETVRLLIVELRATRLRLSDAKESTRAVIDRSVDQMNAAQQLLDGLVGPEPST